MMKRIILCCFGIILIASLLQTCTKKNDFLLQYQPNITNINPTEGYPKSIITIKGKGFSAIAEDNKVTINHIEAMVVEATTTELKVVVPEYATTGEIRIYIYYKNVLIDSAISTQNFNIYNNYIQAPIVNNLLPTQTSYNNLVLLVGKNFTNATPPNSDTPLVIVGVDTMQVKALTDTSILFLISKPLQVGEYIVSVVKKNRNDNKPLTGFSKNNLAIAASALRLKETDVMIGDSLHITGRGLSSAMNLFLSIGNNQVLCPITRIDDTLLAGKISNDIFQYINPKTSDVFNVSVLFNNQQTLNAGSVRVSIVANNLVYLKSTSINNNQGVSVIYSKNNKIKNPIKATLYLNINNVVAAEASNNNVATIDTTITFDKAILKNILGINDDSKVVQAEIKVFTADGNETTYFLGNLTINADASYNTPFTVSNNLKANDVVTITGSHIKPDVNLYQLTGFPNGKAISATSATSTAITFKIPTDIAAGKYENIKLNVDGKDNTLTIIPTITGITPLSGGDSTILTITGYNLYTKNKIYFDTIAVNKFDSIAYPYNSFKDTISSKNLVGNTTYVIGIGDHNSTTSLVTSSQTFLYTISQFKVFTNNATNTTTATDGDNIKVSGKSIQGKNIVLKYNNIQLSLPATKNNDTLITKIIEADIATLNIPNNTTNVQAQVYIELINGTQILAGSIMVKPVASIDGMTPTAGSKIQGTEIISFDGSHLSNSTANYILWIGTTATNAISASGTNVKFKVPQNIASGDSALYLVMNGDTLTNITTPEKITIIPTITKITPTSGGTGTIVTVSGYNFAPSNKLLVQIGNSPSSPPNTVSSDFQALSFTVPNGLFGGMTYPIELIANSNKTISSVTFTYNMSKLQVSSSNAIPTILEANDNLIIKGDGLNNVTEILLKNGTATQRVPVSPTANITTKISDQIISGLDIADNQTSVTVQVYLLIGSTQTLAGSIIVKPTAEITSINPNTGSAVKYNDLITITGKHLSSNLGDFELKLNNDIIPLTSANGNSIQFRIPGNIEGKKDSVYIKMLGNDLQSGKLHNYLKIAPTITSISPTSGTNGTNITIQGHNFGSNDTIAIDTNRIFTTSSNFQTITFILPISNNLQNGMSYPIKLKTNGDSIIAANLFTYNLTGSFTVSSNHTDTTILIATKKINVYGNNLTGINTIVLKYSTASISLPVTSTPTSLQTTNVITDNNIQSLNIPNNKASDVVQVYLQTGSTQTLAGSIIVKPTAEITGINPNTGSVVKYNDLITITGKHLSSNLGDFAIKLHNNINTNIIPATLANGSSVQFRIPGNIENGIDSVSIDMNSIDLQQDKLHNYLKIAPTITSISPTSGSDNTNITIQGYNFGNKDTIVIDTNRIFTNSTNLQTISFTLPASNNLKAGISYPIKIKTNGDSVISSTAFTYMVGNLNIVEVQPLYTDTSHIKVSGTGLQNTTLYLRYNNGAYLPVDTMNTTENSIYTKLIGKNTIDLLGIPANISSVAVGVYVLAGSTYTFVGNVNIKAIPKLYAFSSKPAFVANNTLSIRGDHISTADNYRIGIRIAGDTVWFAPTSLNATTLNLIISDTLTAGKYSVNVKYKDGLNDTLVNLDTIIIKPTISSVTPNNNIGVGNSFTVLGKNLSANTSEIITLLNGANSSANLSVQNATQTSVTINYITTIGIIGTYPLSLEINGQKSSPLNITLKN